MNLHLSPHGGYLVYKRLGGVQDFYACGHLKSLWSLSRRQRHCDINKIISMLHK